MEMGDFLEPGQHCTRWNLKELSRVWSFFFESSKDCGGWGGARMVSTACQGPVGIFKILFFFSHTELCFAVLYWSRSPRSLYGFCHSSQHV